jgi:two-component system sensor histidine kinase KdpD
VLLERALANLIDNALIHAEGHGLRVEAGAVARRVDIRIIDRGPGIRREDRDMVFRPFQRLGDSDNRTGVGLGLALSRGFIEAAGGELDLEDTPGGGCTMVVRIPGAVLTPGAEGEVAGRPAEPATGTTT